MASAEPVSVPEMLLQLQRSVQELQETMQGLTRAVAMIQCHVLGLWDTCTECGPPSYIVGTCTRCMDKNTNIL
jgi:hypothetical protein